MLCICIENPVIAIMSSVLLLLCFLAMTDCSGKLEIASKTEMSSGKNKKTANLAKSGFLFIFSDFLFF